MDGSASVKPFYCLEAGFAWLNSKAPGHGAVSFLAENDWGSIVRNTVDGYWFGGSHQWTPSCGYIEALELAAIGGAA
jgi:hypothetical protein